MDEKCRYELGLEQRRAVLGDAHVDCAQSHGTEFSADFQEMITRYSWGEVWSRPELDRNTRSLVAIATMIALNRSDDFKAHVRAALRLGTTPEHIKEVLLQSAIYCGVSAADSAFRATEAIMAEETDHQH
ncbi:4-carboxymuconolactone decarboxylase [Arthrobacter sp. ISL-85]|uniref:4-carboxymuconolactone decarboxylase n=1 Tax=Arthrobacter sp. ISL-85 TaxID=2819115 RepID=UPI001BE7F014|nr:4-carboxymuconolactone decarboxylase [Arthrobacter sp. ISL-85]MBT2565071.1 4-carboxymuconolactone decarboxylase [Arthrobacter sp. ISL-85]